MEISKTTLIGAACALVTLGSFLLFAIGQITFEQASTAATVFTGLLVSIGFKLSQDQDVKPPVKKPTITKVHPRGLPKVVPEEKGDETGDSKKFLLIFFLAGTLAFTQSCSQASFKKSLEASKDLGAITNQTIDRVRNLFEAKAITTNQKDHIARLLLRIAQAGKRGHEVIVELSKQYATPSDVPVHRWFDVDKAFNDEVVLPFLELLTVVAGLSTETSTYLRVAISQLRSAILVLSKLLNKQNSLLERMRQIEKAGDVYV